MIIDQQIITDLKPTGKMGEVKEILLDLNITKKDLYNPSPDIVQEIFLNLNVGKISILCRVSKKFNDVCNRDFLWKTKVLTDYGLTKKYWVTWRETAKNLFQLNMVNLNTKWINGMTYGEMVKEAQNHPGKGAKTLIDMQIKFYPTTMTFKVYGYPFHEEFRKAARESMKRKLTPEELSTLQHVLTSDLSVIINAFWLYEMNYDHPRDKYPSLFLNKEIAARLPPEKRSMKSFGLIRDLIDVKYYIMRLSSLSDDILIKMKLSKR